MERLTVKNGDGTYEIAEGKTVSDVVERLVKFETMYEALVAEQEKILSDMERLRAAGKTKSVTYHQLMANKLMVMNMIGRIEIYVK